MRLDLAALGFMGGIASFAALGCPAQHVAPDSTPTGTRTACTAGISFCDNHVVRICGDNGYVADKIVCGDSQTCVLGACEDNIVCEPDVFLCVRNELVRCNSAGTALSSRLDCDPDFCVNGACVPVGDTCPPGEAVCVGNSAAVCLADGSGYSVGPTACGSSAVCVDGGCRPKVCEPETSTCEGDVASTCDSWGTGFSDQRVCAARQICVRGRCQILVCNPASTICQGNRLQVCSEDGTVMIQDMDCGPDKVCRDGRCVRGQADAGVPDTRQRDRSTSDLSRPDSGVPDQRRPDSTVPDTARPDTNRPDQARPDLGTTDSALLNCDPVDDAYEPDDLRSQASTISSATSITDLVACDEFDWFAVDAPANKSLRVSLQFTHAEADLDLEVYRNSEVAAVAKSQSTTDNESVEMWDTPATVYIMVHNYSYPDKIGRYSLTTELTDPPICGDGTVNGNERCDTNIASGNSGACPSSCTDSGCSHKTLTGSGTCQARCEASTITACNSTDDCCPTGCTASTDQKCVDLGYTSCSSDIDCPVSRYCDLQRPAPVCKVGCRHSSPSGCDSAHACSADHRCVLSNILPHQRCDTCSENNPCANGLDCDLLTQRCSPSCSLMADDCATTVGESSQCNLVVCLMGPCVCLQDDCP